MDTKQNLNVANFKKQVGFTLIEMIGVLAIIAVLVGAVAPRIFEAIRDSKVSNLATLVKIAETATTKYYADLGHLRTLSDVSANTAAIDNNGYIGTAASNNSFARVLTHSKTTNQSSGFWATFKGPYMNSFDENGSPIGTSMQLNTDNATAATVVGTNGANFDINGDGSPSISTNADIVYLTILGASPSEWEKIDVLVDNTLTGGTVAERQLDGRVKYSGTTIQILIANN